MRAHAEDMVVGILLPAVRGGTQGACEEFGSGRDRGSFLRGVVAHGPVAFMEQFFVVSPGALRKRGQVQDLRGKAHGGIFPGRKIVAASAVKVTHMQSLGASETLDPFFKGDQQAVSYTHLTLPTIYSV